MIPTFRPSLGQEELDAIGAVFASRWLGMGEVSRRFEQRLAEFLGVPHVVAVDHGTSALHLALDAIELEPGDEVIVPSMTFAATVQAIRMAGATPVFCEVEPHTLNTDVPDALGRITGRTRAILPVHFAGLPCDLDSLLKGARRHGLRVVEDAAHALGASYRGRRIGGFGDLSCFSFDAIKHVTCGEGGAVATCDETLARRVAVCRRLGMESGPGTQDSSEARWQYRVVTHGFRYHLPDLNAAIGLAQLDKLPMFQRRKREIVRAYDEAFAGQPGLEPLRHEAESACPWAYVVRVFENRRDAFRAHLRARGVMTLVQFIPNHLQPAFARFRVELPVTERLFEEIVSLPLFVEMTDADVQTVIDAVLSFLEAPVPTEVGG